MYTQSMHIGIKCGELFFYLSFLFYYDLGVAKSHECTNNFIY